MYVRNSSKKQKYLIVKLFGTRSCDGSLYVCCCRYNGCINSRDVHIKTGVSGPPYQSLRPSLQTEKLQHGFEHNFCISTRILVFFSSFRRGERALHHHLRCSCYLLHPNSVRKAEANNKG